MTVQKIVSLLIISIPLLTTLVPPVFSQKINQVAFNVEIGDSQARSGDIVSFENGKYLLSSKEYDPGIYGVVYADAQVSLGKISPATKAVVVSGEVLVNVSTSGGEIKRGDLLTTSKDKGVAQKSTKSGHVVGKALKDFPTKGDTAKEGQIPALINISYNQISSQSEALTQQGIDQVARKVSSSIVSGNIPDLLKYIFALLLGAISFFVGLSHFVRTNSTAVEAIARNPLAKADIQRQLVFGTAGILVVCALGLGIAVWILIFL